MPVQQHPVPQQVTAYEFRLIGDMTLKQFGYLAGGVLMGLLFYSLPLAGFLKWPLVLFWGFLGFAFAFMPIEERPLTTWLSSFVKAVISPTLFVWKKKPEKPEIFASSSKIATPATSSLITDKNQLNQYLKTLPQEEKSPLDKKEEEFLKQIATLFPTLTPPSLKTVPSNVFSANIAAEEKPPVAPPAKPPKKLPKPPIEAFFYPKPKRPKKPAVEAKTSKELPIPIPPTIPNIVTGMVLDQKGEIIEGAILEIRNSQGMPVRALKTNKLGQFRIATPLENGVYEIEIEKEGYNFDIIKLEAKGEIIQPLEIRAK